MTREEKQLLIKDLCSRLPYGVICKVVSTINPFIGGDRKLNIFWLDKVTKGGYDVKPYLRPMSSMTEEEKKEFNSIAFAGYEYGRDTDWLDTHYFDYRSLIEKGLALEAPENMYKTE